MEELKKLERRFKDAFEKAHTTEEESKKKLFEVAYTLEDIFARHAMHDYKMHRNFANPN